MFGQDFGHRLRELRLAQGLTKEKFCEGDEVLSVRQLTRIETGKSQPKLERDLRALGKTSEYIFIGIAWREVYRLKVAGRIPQSQISIDACN